MKKYIVPEIKVVTLSQDTDLMAASPSFSGNAGTRPGGGSGTKPGPGDTGDAKRYNVWEVE